MWRRSPLTYYKCPHLPIIHFCEVCTLFFLQHFYKLRNWRCDPQIRGEHFGNKARQWLTTSTYTSSPCKTFVAEQGKAEMPNTYPIGKGFSIFFLCGLLLSGRGSVERNAWNKDLSPLNNGKLSLSPLFLIQYPDIWAIMQLCIHYVFLQCDSWCSFSSGNKVRPWWQWVTTPITISGLACLCLSIVCIAH